MLLCLYALSSCHILEAEPLPSIVGKHPKVTYPRIPKKKLHEHPKSSSPLADTMASRLRIIDPEKMMARS